VRYYGEKVLKVYKKAIEYNKKTIYMKLKNLFKR